MWNTLSSPSPLKYYTHYLGCSWCSWCSRCTWCLLFMFYFAPSAWCSLFFFIIFTHNVFTISLLVVTFWFRKIVWDIITVLYVKWSLTVIDSTPRYIWKEQFKLLFRNKLSLTYDKDEAKALFLKHTKHLQKTSIENLHLHQIHVLKKICFFTI